MNTLIVVSISTLFFAGIYLLLANQFWKVIIGTVFLSHAVNLVLLASGGYEDRAQPPILADSVSHYMDPLPQALILTAIVISFGVTAFILIVLRQVHHSTGSSDLQQIERVEWRGEKPEDE